MNQRSGSPAHFLFFWFARLPAVWAILAGFGVSALLGSAEWYVRVLAIGFVSLIVLGLGYVARARLIAQLRAEASAPSTQVSSTPPPERTRAAQRRIRRRR
jgi:hypothetical protein